MPFDFAQAKVLTRRTVQRTFGVQAFYRAPDSVDAPIEMRARWHNSISKPYGGLQDGDGYAQIIEGIDQIVCIPEDVNGVAVALDRNGEFTFPSIPGVTFVLELRLPATGPLEEAWQVVRK